MTNQLEIRHLEYFLVLADTLHYGKAAEQLYISQSALSQQIQKLEILLGQQLFNRTNRKVSLNRAGVLFQKEALLIVNQMQRSLERWQLALEEVEGILKIGFVGSAMQRFLPPIIKRFSEEYPKIRLHLNDLSNIDQIRSLEKLQLDVGFVRAKNLPDNIQSVSVYKENFTLVLPEAHPITKENFTDIGQLANDPFILFPNKRSQMYYEQIINLCHDFGFTPKITHRAIHGPTIFKLVEGGLGVSIIPVSLKDEYNYRIRYIELHDIPQQTELFAVWNKENSNESLGYFLKLADILRT